MLVNEKDKPKITLQVPIEQFTQYDNLADRWNFNDFVEEVRKLFSL